MANGLVDQKQVAKPPATIRGTLESDAFKAAISKVLPKHMTPERMARVAITAITRNPKLADCDQASFFRCLMDLSAWGLEPDGRRAHLIPFNNTKTRTVECQLILDYKGIVELCYRSGVVESIHADVIREGDLFGYDMGAITRHVPHWLRTDDEKPEESGKVIGAYCTIQLKGGVIKTEVMPKVDIEAIRARSRASGSGPWTTDWNEMAKKTVFRRASKWIPLSAEIRDVVDYDDDTLDLEHQPAKRTAPVLDDLTDRLLESRPVEEFARDSDEGKEDQQQTT